MLISLPYAIANWFGGLWVGRSAAAIGSLTIHPAFYSVYPWYNLPLNLAVHFGMVLLGLTVYWWRPVLTYPLQLLWSVSSAAPGIGSPATGL
jgi:hypothetical protein